MINTLFEPNEDTYKKITNTYNNTKKFIYIKRRKKEEELPNYKIIESLLGRH